MDNTSRKTRYVYDSLKGRQRDRNKDGILDVKDDLYCIIGVFDGVSSAIEAKKGVSFAVKYIKNNHRDYYRKEGFLLSKLMSDLNSSLIESNIKEPYTTYTIAYVPKACDKDVLISSLGDSRVYAITNQYISQVSFYKNDHIHSNFLTKYLGNNELVDSDFKEMSLANSDESLIFCTDGFYTVMESSHTRLSEAHRVFNLKSLSAIKNGLTRLVDGTNDDDASYVFVRWDNVCN